MQVNKQAIGKPVCTRDFGPGTIVSITKDSEDQHYLYWNVKVKLDDGDIVVVNNSDIFSIEGQ